MSEYNLHMRGDVSVQAGLCVSVPCSFSYPRGSWNPPEPHIYWFRVPDGIDDDPVATNNPKRPVRADSRGRFRLHGDPRTNCSLSIGPAGSGDRGTYYFRVETGNIRYTFREPKLSLQVTGLTERPDIHLGESLRAGHPAKLVCSLRGSCEGQSLTFSWAGAALASLDPRGPWSSALSFTPEPQHHGTNLTCRVTLPGPGPSTERTVRLNVTYPPQTVTASIAQGYGSGCRMLKNGSNIPIPEGQSLCLVCEAPSNPPASLSWFWGSPALTATPLSNSSTLALPLAGTPEEGALTCLAQHPLGSQQILLSFSLQSPPRLLGPSCSPEDDGGLLCLCSARARPAPALRWRLGEQLLAGNSSNASVGVTFSPGGLWANSSLRLRGGLGAALGLCCEAQNAQGTTRSVLLLQPGRPAVLAGLVPGALGGAGATAVLSLCLCLLVYGIAKARRHRGAGRPEARDDEDPVMGSVVWAAPAPGEPQDIHYASLSFHGAKAREPQEPEAATVYSEIRTSA